MVSLDDEKNVFHTFEGKYKIVDFKIFFLLKSDLDGSSRINNNYSWSKKCWEHNFAHANYMCLMRNYHVAK